MVTSIVLLLNIMGHDRVFILLGLVLLKLFSENLFIFLIWVTPLWLVPTNMNVTRFSGFPYETVSKGNLVCLSSMATEWLANFTECSARQNTLIKHI